MSEKNDFFISYTSIDEKWATWIAWQLEKAGYTFIIQAWDFTPGMNFVLEMQNALINCERVIAVLSPEYFKSSFCAPEWATKFAEDPSGKDSYIIPVRIADFKPEGLFRSIIYIDIYGLNEEEAIGKLITGIKGERPTEKPIFPGSVATPVAALPKPRFPGHLPFNNLNRRNPLFTGRDDILEKIHEAFKSGNTTALTQAIIGLGGVGKTQIVLEYAHRYGYLYDMIWWVHAETELTLIKDYRDFALTKGLITNEVEEQDRIIKVVKNWLNSNDNWLFIFDDSETDVNLYGFLSSSSRGHTLITSRYKNYQRLGSVTPIDVYKPEEASNFLKKSTQLNDDAGANKLGAILGYLPLALDQAAAYIFETNINFDHYVERFKRYKLALFDENIPFDYHSTVAVTWQVSLEKIAYESAKQLLYLLSYFAPDNFDINLFINYSTLLPEPLASDVINNLAFDKILAELTRYSLIRVSNNSRSSIHSLLQEVIRQFVTTTEWIAYDLSIIRQVFNFDRKDTNNWGQLNELLPHVMSVTSYANSNNINLNTVSWLYFKSGCWLIQTAEYNEALKWNFKALEIQYPILGPDNPDIATIYNNIAIAYNHTGSFSNALEYHKKALYIRERVYGTDNTITAESRNNIAVMYVIMGDVSRALELYRKNLTIYEKDFGVEHIETVTTLNNIADAYDRLGDYQKAFDLYQNILQIRSKVLGLNHPDTASTYNNIAIIYSEMNDYQHALDFHQIALSIREKVLGTSHPDTAASYVNIAGIISKYGNYTLALELYQKALKIYEITAGINHPDTANIYNSIAVTHDYQHDFSVALQWYIKAYNVYVNHNMTAHPNAVILKKNMRLSYIDNGGHEVDFDQWLEDQIKLTQS
jgi:tetratricopeptide (TPR) repeat protein